LNILDPSRIFHSLGYFPLPGHRPMGDTAGAGDFDFYKAMAMSSNPYFATYGTQPGVLQEIIAIGDRLHLGERTGIMPHQEARGNFITLDRVSSNWHYGDTANISIGQGELDVTPIQIAVMTAAVANGGKVFWPRLVSRIESADGSAVLETFSEGRVRDNLGVSARTLKIVHGGMMADTQSADGTGHLLNVPGWSIAGKTGTAEVENRHHTVVKDLKDTWFVSFAPEEAPRYVVVVAVEGGISGGLTGVPIAHKIYLALQARDKDLQRKGPYRPQALAVAQ
jgi:penicillin-binding protein 2